MPAQPITDTPLELAVLGACPNGILVYRQDGRCIYANSAAADITGATEAQLLQQNFRQIQSWQEADILHLAEASLKNGNLQSREVHLISSFGRPVWAIFHFSQLQHRDNPHLLLTMQDVTRQKQVEQHLLEREQKFRTLANNVPDNIVRYDLQGRILYINPALQTTLGLPLEKVQGKTPPELVPDDTYDSLFAAILLAAREGKTSDINLQLSQPNSSPRYHAVRVVPEFDSCGKQVSVLAVGRDMTEIRRAEESLRLSASVFHNSAEGVMITDPDGLILSTNPAFTEITGYSAAEVLGRTPKMLRSQQHEDAFYRDMWQQLLAQGMWQGEIWNRRKNGEAYLQWLSINRIDDDNGKPVRYVGVFHDITELRQKDERIEHLAFHDALTGLPNRTLLLDRLQSAIQRARREDRQLGVLFLDLDRFKSVNDGLGHDNGDMLLQQVAQRIRSRVRLADTVARLSGDEFVILAEGLHNCESCAQLAQELIDAIAQPIELKQQSMRISASVGIACYPEDGQDHLELLKCADMAMYAAKDAGRNTFRFFRQEMLQQASQKMALEIDLRRAIIKDELVLHYQPKVDLQTGLLRGCEALIRWQHPDQGLLYPASFIDVAEDSPLILDVGNWVLNEACRQIAEWQTQGLQIPVAVNLSARNLESEHLVQQIQALADAHGINPNLLELEITESSVMKNPLQVVELLTQLRKLGVSIAIDDFGTGYSCLAYLRKLPIDVLKIDRFFIREMHHDLQGAQIVKTILGLAQALHLNVVAEGVESRQHADILAALGCDLAQGYHYSPPISAAELSQWQPSH